MAKWVVETIYTTYLDTIPIKAAVARGGYDPDAPIRTVKVERGKLEPPEDLLHLFIGPAIKQLEEVKKVMDKDTVL